MNNLAPRNLSLEDYNYNNQEIADDIYMSLNSSNFEGLSVSGKVIIIIVILPVCFGIPLSFCNYMHTPMFIL